ncbi:MAG TPA: VacJ family lipoprotein [Rhizomicrobium sp.]|jgi:phospholipid-binding lipoprotein MlaA|nr:VacJ family lipoprotein [Rhizomicrobium sp.]
MLRRFFPLFTALLMGAGLAACTTTTNPDSLAQNDPYEPTNRAIFDFNQKLDRHVARPVAVFYNHAVPRPAREGIHNMLSNMDEPVTFANDILQGEKTRAVETFGRIVINSTIGIGGLIDVAAKMGIPDHSEDFGQTLGVWGAGEGSYFVAPLLGPAPPRDLAGRIVDYGFDPFTYARFDGYRTLAYARAGLGIVDLRARNVDTLDQIERTSVDFYATQRSLYRQYRNSEIRNGAPDLNELPEL